MSRLSDLLAPQAMQLRQPISADVPASLAQLLLVGMQRQGGGLPNIAVQMPQAQAPSFNMQMPQQESMESLYRLQKQKELDAQAEQAGQQEAAYLESLPKNLSYEDQAIALLHGPTKNLQELGAQIYANIAKAASTPKNFQLAKVGVPGSPDFEQNVYLDENGQPVPFGEPLKRSSGVSIYTGEGEKPISSAEAVNMVTPEGNPANVPVGMTHKQAANQGYRYLSKPSDTEVQRESSSTLTNSMVNEIKTLRAKGASVSGVSGFVQDLRSGTGLVGVGANAALDKLGFKQEPNNVKLYANTQALGNTLLQLMRGASVGPAEKEDFVKQLPNAGQPDELFDANLALTMKNIKLLQDRIAKSTGRNQKENSQPPQRGFSKSGKPIFFNDETQQWEYE